MKNECKNVEEFKIQEGETEKSASIKTGWFGEDGYHPFIGGCGITLAQPSLAAARRQVFRYLVRDFRHERQEHLDRIAELDTLLKKLGSEVSNLDKFKV